jgi:hypothetical protein
MKLKLFALFVSSLMGWAQSTVIYQLDFMVKALSTTWNGVNLIKDIEVFDYRPNIGDIFYGSITLEDSILAIDGNRQA